MPIDFRLLDLCTDLSSEISPSSFSSSSLLIFCESLKNEVFYSIRVRCKIHCAMLQFSRRRLYDVVTDTSAETASGNVFKRHSKLFTRLLTRLMTGETVSRYCVKFQRVTYYDRVSLNKYLKIDKGERERSRDIHYCFSARACRGN